MVEAKDKPGSLIMVVEEDPETPLSLSFITIPKLLSSPEREAMLNKTIQYSYKKWSYSEGIIGDLRSYTYKLEVIDGPHKNWKISEEISH